MILWIFKSIVLNSYRSIIKSIGNTVKKAVNTVKTVVTAAKPIVKAVKNNAVTTVKVATKATYQNNVVTPAETVYKASQAASRNLQSNSAALKESGRVGNAFANIKY